MRTVHLIWGTLGLVLFLLTGQYMARIAGVPDLPDTERMLYRAGHLYLMLGFVVNIALGCAMARDAALTRLQLLCSGLVLLSSLLLLLGFAVEAGASNLNRPLTSIGLFTMFAAAALLVQREIILWLKHKRSKA